MARKIDVYYPGNSFPSVSITGGRCSLSCAHCDGRYLGGMVDVSEGQSLYEFGLTLWNKAGIGILVSGGCGPGGALPINDNILDQISRLKSETGLKINMHTGLVGRKTAESIAASGVDAISYDILGDDSTIKEVLKLDKKVEDYIRSYQALEDAGLHVVPHILAGFNYGKERGERRAIGIAASFEPKRVVLIILIPTPGTPMENVRPLDKVTVLSLAEYMRGSLKGNLVLGCMRPKGSHGIEFGVLEKGFNGIVLPSKRTMTRISESGWETKRYEHCCAIDPIDP